MGPAPAAGGPGGAAAGSTDPAGPLADATKAQTPASSKPYQGVKTSVGADSFHMAFLKSMSGWTKNKTKPREIML